MFSQPSALERRAIQLMLTTSGTVLLPLGLVDVTFSVNVVGFLLP